MEKKQKTKRILTRLTSVLLVLAMALGVMPGFGSITPSAEAAGNAGNLFEGQDADVFSALGFDTSQIPEGFDLDSTDNPYGRDKLPGNQVFEILHGKTEQYTLYGSNNNSLSYNNIGSAAGVSRAMPAGVELFAGAVGDFNGDGLVGQTAYVGLKDVTSKLSTSTASELCLYVFDPASGEYSAALSLGAVTPFYTYISGSEQANEQTRFYDRWQNLLQITSGDYDGDGVSEIAVYIADKNNPRIDVYKYQRTSQSGPNDWLDMSNWGRVWSHAVAKTGASFVPNMVSLLSADLNRDGVDDLAISSGSTVYRYQTIVDSSVVYVHSNLILLHSAASQATVLWGGKSNMLQTPYQLDLGKSHEKLGELARVSLSFGDANQDGTPELVVTGQPVSDLTSNKQRSVAVYAYDETEGLIIESAETIGVVDGSNVSHTDSKGNTTTEFSSANGYDDKYYSNPTMVTNAAIMHPKGSDYNFIYVDSMLVKYYESSLSIGYELDDKNYDTENGSLSGGWGHSDGTHYSEYGAVAGDINGEGYDTLVTHFFSPVSEATSVHELKHQYAALGVPGAGGLASKRSARSDKSSYFTMPDVDIDTTLIEYSGKHYLTYSDPQVLAVIAAAPYFEDVDIISDYDYAWQNSTTYSRINGKGHSSIVAVDFSIGAYGNAEIEGGGAKGELETSLGFTLNWEKETTKSYEYTLTFETSQDEDAVAFYSIPTENYLYYIHTPDGNGGYQTETKIISNTFNPAYQVLSLDYYESIQGNYSELPPIRGVLLSSRPGDPSSYPSSVPSSAIAEWKDDPAGVSFGNGAITQEITVTEEEAESYQLGGYWDFKAGGGIGIQSDVGQVEVDITGGVEWSLNPSGGWADINLEGTSISGTVANMPKEFQDYGYYFSWKIFTYAMSINGSNRIPVVTYAVNDISQPPKLPSDFQQNFEKSTTTSNYLTWTYDEAVSDFYIYKYYDFPVGGGLKLLEKINAGDNTHRTPKYDADGKLYYEYYYVDEGLTPYTEYQYAIQVERANPVPPLSAPSNLLTVRTKAENGYPTLKISMSNEDSDGNLLVYPDKAAFMSVDVKGPKGESISNYYSTVQYQWQKLQKGVWVDLVNETNMTLTFSNAGVSAAGTYRCLVNVQTKADGAFISAFSHTAELVHSKRTSIFSELSVSDAQGGGVELYAAIANPHSDSATIPSGTITFNLTSSETGETYQYFVELDATGTASKIMDSQLPEGMYQVHAYYSGSYIFKSSSSDTIYLSQISSGYNIEAPLAVVYGNGADVRFMRINKTGGVTSSVNADAETFALKVGTALAAGKLSGAAQLPSNNAVTKGEKYFFSDADGIVYSFAAAATGTVEIKNGFAFYEDSSSYLTRGEATGTYRLAENTPAGSYVLQMAYDNFSETVYKPIVVAPRSMTLQLPTLQAGEDTNGSSTVAAPKIGELAVVGGTWAECDLEDSVLKDALRLLEVDTARYINTAGRVFTGATVDDFCGYYTIQNPVTSTLAENYTLTFLDGSITILGATNDLYVGAREFEELPVGTLYAVSPTYAYTRDELTGTAGNYQGGLLQKHQTGTRVVFNAVPDTGYEVYDWYINGVAQGVKSNSLVHIMLREETRVEVQFDVQKNSLSFGTAGDAGGGTIVCNDAELTSGSVLLANSLLTFEAVANKGYHFKEWRYTKVGAGTVYDNSDEGQASSTFDFIMPSASCSVYAVFERDFYTLTYQDHNGNNGLTAWYSGSSTSDATSEAARIEIPNGGRVKGDTQVIIEPEKGCVLDDAYNYVSIGSQGVADYLAGTYTFIMDEDTFVTGRTLRQDYSVQLNFDITRTTDQPVGASIICAYDETEVALHQSEGDSHTVSMIRGGSPVSVQVLYPEYYELIGWGYSGTSFLTASETKDNLAVPLTDAQGSPVKKGTAYYYQVNTPEGNKLYYFTATETGLASWDDTAVRILAAGETYSIAKLDGNRVLTVYLKEKPVHTVTLHEISANGSYDYALPPGATATAADVLTLHEGDDFTVSVTPKQKNTVSYWEVTPESTGVPLRHQASSLSYTIPQVNEDYYFRPIFSPTTYNTISWPAISNASNGIVLSPESGYLSSVASGKDFWFKLGGSSSSLIDKVFANGNEFTVLGNRVGETTYTYDSVNKIYKITNITENHVLTLSLKELGVTVNAVDISALNGAGWNYNTATQELIINRSGLTISGSNNVLASKLSIKLGEAAGTVTFRDLSIISDADATIVSTRSEGITVTASGGNTIQNVSGGASVSVLRSQHDATIRGNGALALSAVTPDTANSRIVTLINILDGNAVVTGNVKLTLTGEHKGTPGEHGFVGISAHNLTVGAQSSTAEPALRIDLTNDSEKAIGLVTNDVNVYGGNFLVYADGAGAEVARLNTYGGITEIIGSKATFSAASIAAGASLNAHFAHGYQLRTKEEAMYSTEYKLTQTKAADYSVPNQYDALDIGSLERLNKAGYVRIIGIEYADQDNITLSVKDENNQVWSGVIDLSSYSGKYFYLDDSTPGVYTFASAEDGEFFQPDNLETLKAAHFIAVVKTPDLTLGSYHFKYKGTGNIDSPSSYEMQPDEDARYHYSITGTTTAESAGIIATRESVASLTLDNLTYNQLSIGKNPLYLVGDSQLTARMTSSLVAEEGILNLYSEDGTGTLTLSVGRDSGAIPVVKNSATDNLRINLHNVKALTVLAQESADSTVMSTAYRVYYYDDLLSHTEGQYGYAWLQDVGSGSAARATTNTSFDGTGTISAKYLKLYSATADASVHPSSFAYNQAGMGSTLLDLFFYYPTVNGQVHIFDPDTATANTSGGYVVLLDENKDKVADWREGENYHWIEEFGSYVFAFERNTLQTLPIGQYIVRVFFYDEDISDATTYTLDVPLTISNSYTSTGGLTISPATVTTRRGETIDLSTSFTGTVPSRYEWILEPEANSSVLKNNSKATVTIGDTAPFYTPFQVTAISYIGESSLPAGSATAMITVVPSVRNIAISCPTETPSADESYTLYHNTVDNTAKLWSFLADVTLDDDTTSDDVVWSLWGSIRRDTAVDASTGVLTIHPAETGTGGILKLTATYTHGDNTTAEKTVVIRLSSDARVSYTAAGVNGTITSAVYGASETTIPAAGAWIPANNKVVVTAAPDDEFVVNNWYVNGVSVMENNDFIVDSDNHTLTFTTAKMSHYNITADYINENAFAITYSAEGYGSVSAQSGGAEFPSGSMVVKGGSVTLTAAPEEHCTVKHWLVDGTEYKVSGSIYTGTTLTLSGIEAAHTVVAVFEGNAVQLSLMAAISSPLDTQPNGTLTAYVNGEKVSATETSESDYSVTYTAQAAALDQIVIYAKPDDGYQVKAWYLYDGKSYQEIANTFEMASYVIDSIVTNLKLKVVFEKITTHDMTIFVNSFENGAGKVLYGAEEATATLGGMVFPVNHHDAVTLLAVAEPGSYLYEWEVTGAQYYENGDVITLLDVTADVQVKALFRKSYFNVSVNGSGNGSIYAEYDTKDVDGFAGTILMGDSEAVKGGAEVIFVVTPDGNSILSSLTVNGEKVSPTFDDSADSFLYTVMPLTGRLDAVAEFTAVNRFPVTAPIDYEINTGDDELPAYEDTGLVTIGFVPDGASMDSDDTDRIVEIAEGGAATMKFTPEAGYTVNMEILMTELGKILQSQSSQATYSISIQGDQNGSYHLATISGVDKALDFSAMESPFETSSATLYEVSIQKDGKGTLEVYYNQARLLSGAEVPEGAELTIIVTPEVHYGVSALTANSDDLTPVLTPLPDTLPAETTTYVVTEPIHICAEFELSEHKVTVNLIGTGSGEVIVNDKGLSSSATSYFEVGCELTIAASPEEGAKLSNLVVGGTHVGGNSHTVSALSEDLTVTAVFEALTCAVTFNTPENGTLSLLKGDGSKITNGEILPVGTSMIVIATPNSHYKIASLTAGGVSLTGNTYIVNPGKSNEINVSFALAEVQVNWQNPEGGTLKVTLPDGTEVTRGQYVPVDTLLYIQATANKDYTLETLLLNQTAIANDSEQTITTASEIAATFKYTGVVPPKPDPEPNPGGGTTIINNGGSTTIINGLDSDSDYTVMTTIIGNGTVKVMVDGEELKNGSSVKIGTILTITATPTTGVSLERLTVNGVDFVSGKEYEVYANTEIRATFDEVLPYYLSDSGSRVFLGFAYEGNQNGQWDEEEYIAPAGVTVQFSPNHKVFTDVQGHWGEANIDFVARREILLGTSATEFSPNANINRGMFAAAIGRLYERSYGEILPAQEHAFTDCDYDAYYGKYVDWAASNGILLGYGDGRFGPEDQITREQMAAILYRFATFLNMLPETMDTNLTFRDGTTISGWAQDAALFCQTTGLIQGIGDNVFAPTAFATRAELATILMKFVQYVLG